MGETRRLDLSCVSIVPFVSIGCFDSFGSCVSCRVAQVAVVTMNCVLLARIAVVTDYCVLLQWSR